MARIPPITSSSSAIRAPSLKAVDRFHETGLRCGGIDNGAPGVRHGRYYCAFLKDFDGNNIEAGVYADAPENAQA